MTRRRAVLLIVQTLFGVALLWLWTRGVDLQAVTRLLMGANAFPVLLAAGLGLLAGGLRVLRWQILLRPITRVPYLELYRIWVTAALVNFLLPLRTGELARGWLLKRQNKAPFAAALSTVALDRALDLLAILMLGAAGAALGVTLVARLSSVILAGAALLLGFIVFVGLAIWRRSALVTLIAHLMPSQLGASMRARLMEAGETFLSVFSIAAKHPRALAQAVLLSLAASAADALSLYLIFTALGSSTAAPVVMTGYALMALTYLVPGAPGYIGSTEAFGLLIFTSLGLGADLTAAAVLISHATNSLLVVSLGGVGLWSLGLRPAAAMRSLLGSRRAAMTEIRPSHEA